MEKEKKISPAKVVVLGEGSHISINFYSESRKDISNSEIRKRIIQ